MQSLILTLYVTVMSAFCSADITCRDQLGNTVDWFVVYKLPRLSAGSENVKRGVGQVYMDSNSKQWKLLDQGIDGKNHPVYYTLNQIYNNSRSSKQDANIMYAMYNDETPSGKTSESRGHTKGDICFDKSSGFWLVHSVPKFPPPPNESYSYPETGTIYGQSMLCVSMAYKYLNVIGKQLQFNYPQIYTSSLPSDFEAENKDMAAAIAGEHVTSSPFSNKVVLSSLAGNKFVSFAKCKDFGEDLYDGLVAPSLASDLLVESWMHGNKDNLPSNCSCKYTVKNIQKLSILNMSFDEMNDHAKWAVSPKGTTRSLYPSVDQLQWTCIGDINRQKSQKKRGGGTVCTNLPAIWNGYSNLVKSFEQCP
jgi:deoxyribonuclease-2